MVRIRARREKPGLRPQHLKALRACSSFSGGHLEGDAVDSQEILYFPGKKMEGGNYQWDIGTAGSTTMLAFSIIPLALYSRKPSTIAVTGGLFQDFAPSAFHMQNVLLPLLGRMGGNIQLRVDRPGYVPKGQGRLSLHIEPLKRAPLSLRRLRRGEVKTVYGISLASHLTREKVAERMADACRTFLEEHGYRPKIDVINDTSAVQKGAALFICATTDTDCILGADQAGRLGRQSEKIAEFVGRSLLEDLETGATTDRHLADQLILFAALARDKSEYVIPGITEHIQANLWLVSKILGAKTQLRDRLLKIDGIGLAPPTD
jgi:RNA 3'-terminal phosphate cyclase (ATP)